MVESLVRPTEELREAAAGTEGTLTNWLNDNRGFFHDIKLCESNTGFICFIKPAVQCLCNLQCCDKVCDAFLHLDSRAITRRTSPYTTCLC